MSRKVTGDQNIESHIKNAVVQLRASKGSAEEADALWQPPVDKAKGDEWYLEGTSSYTGKRSGKSNRSMQRFMRSEFWRFAVTAAAAVLVIAALSYYQFLVRVDTSVFFDVNPSFTLSVNRLNRVVFVDSDNDDAKAILAGADLTGKELEDAVETLFDVMKEQGYFDEEEKTVLVSVDCSSRERLAKITEDLTEEINEYLTQNTGGGSVFGQTVHVDEETRKFARSHRISPGKAALVLKIAEEHPEQDTEKMASLTMNELVSYLHSQNIDLRDSLDYRGADLDQRWKQEEEERGEKAGQETMQETGQESGQSGQESGQRDQDSGQSDQGSDQETGRESGQSEERSGDSGAGQTAQMQEGNIRLEDAGSNGEGLENREDAASGGGEGLDPEQPQGEGSQNEEGDAIQGAGNGSTQMTKENPGLLSPGQETPSEQ